MIEHAVNVMKSCFDGTDILILSEIYRTEPEEFCPLGYLGVDLYIDGKIVFFPYHIAESIHAYGKHIAEEFVYSSLKNKTE